MRGWQAVEQQQWLPERDALAELRRRLHRSAEEVAQNWLHRSAEEVAQNWPAEVSHEEIKRAAAVRLRSLHLVWHKPSEVPPPPPPPVRASRPCRDPTARLRTRSDLSRLPEKAYSIAGGYSALSLFNVDDAFPNLVSVTVNHLPALRERDDRWGKRYRMVNHAVLGECAYGLMVSDPKFSVTELARKEA